MKQHTYKNKIKWKKANILLPLLCSMLSYELPKPEPNMFIKMPGRKHLEFGRLKETAFQIGFLVVPSLEPFMTMFLHSP